MNGLELETWLHLGGHGRYVWSAWGVALLLLVAEGLWTRRRLRQSLAALARPEEVADSGLPSEMSTDSPSQFDTEPAPETEPASAAAPKAKP